MGPIRLPGSPEIFEGRVHGAIRRAVVIGNGFAGAENQCIGLVRALGLASRYSLHRVSRPRGGINEWLHWLPVSLHLKVDRFFRQICGGDWRLLRITADGRRQAIPKTERTGLLNVLEADAKQIATMARDTFYKDGPMLVVASGRDTISVASSIRRLAPENVFVVQIQHPRTHLNRFDLVITPHHDYYPLTHHAQEQIPWFLRRWITPREPPDRHVILTAGALHQADSAARRIAASVWHDEFAPLPKPLLVVNIGGPTSNMSCTINVTIVYVLAHYPGSLLLKCHHSFVDFLVLDHAFCL